MSNDGNQKVNDDNKHQARSSTRLRRGIYLLPNLLTTTALFAGFYAIVAAMQGQFHMAAIAIYVAMMADTLDGRVARLTGTESSFGAEYDSLSDLVSFGVAPALVMYSLALNLLGKVGWLVAFCYVAATALRLARFNIQTAVSDKRYFRGLPCTSAAGFMAGVVWLQEIFHIEMTHVMTTVLAVVVFSVAACMVSNIYYLSFKDLDLRGKIPFFMTLLIILIVIAVALNPPIVLFSTFFMYAISGPCMALQRWRRKKSKKQVAQ